MTGKDLIIYILNNNLENEPIFKDGKLIGFISPSEAANKFEVGLSTIHVWIKMGIIDSVKIGDCMFVPSNIKDPRKSKGEITIEKS